MSFLVANPIRSYFRPVIAIVALVLRLLAALVSLVTMQGRLPFILSTAAVADEGLVIIPMMIKLIVLLAYNQTSPCA